MWRRASNVKVDSLEPAMGDPGGGSDFAGFYNHLGIPIAEWGFGGGGGNYHSAYDTFAWNSHFGDSTYAYHATAGMIGTAMLLRLANAEVLPYDYVEFARTMKRYLPAMETSLSNRKWSWSSRGLADAIDHMETSARSYADERDRALAASGGVDATRRNGANQALLRVERAFTRPSGLRTRPWYRNLIYVADENNGYANMVFPSVNEAIRATDEALTGRELADLAARFEAASKALDDARHALGGS